MAKRTGGSRGRQQLIQWMKGGSIRERGQSAIARALDVSQAAVRQWVAGIARPDEANRVALFALTGVASASWELPEERKALARTLKRIARTASSAPPSGEAAP